MLCRLRYNYSNKRDDINNILSQRIQHNKPLTSKLFLAQKMLNLETEIFVHVYNIRPMR